MSLNDLQDCPVMIEYLMLSEINDSPNDAMALAQWLHGLNVHVNLIPFNEIEESSLTGSSRPCIESFANRLKAMGLKTTTRYSLGQDIGAACGQLIQQKNRTLVRELSNVRHT